MPNSATDGLLRCCLKHGAAFEHTKMANDWIKMRVNLSADPAVIGIAARTKLDRFSVVGRLHALWAWADEQSEDGFLPHVTVDVIDDLLRRKGFADAVAQVGWLEVSAEGIRIPRFDRHNGESAKKRALATERQRDKRQRENAQTCDVSNTPVTEVSRTERDESVTREEKSREEKNIRPRAEAREADRTLPETLNTSEFRAAWERWVTWWAETHRHGRPMPNATADLHLGTCLKLGPTLAIEGINNAIARGLREPALPLNSTQQKPAAYEPPLKYV